MRQEAGAFQSVKSKVDHLKMIQDVRKISQRVKETVDPVVKQAILPVEQILEKAKPVVQDLLQETKTVIGETTRKISQR